MARATLIAADRQVSYRRFIQLYQRDYRQDFDAAARHAGFTSGISALRADPRVIISIEGNVDTPEAVDVCVECRRHRDSPSYPSTRRPLDPRARLLVGHRYASV